MVPLVVELRMGGGVVVALVVGLTGEGVVGKVRAEGRVRKKARVCRVSFIVTVVKFVRCQWWRRRVCYYREAG